MEKYISVRIKNAKLRQISRGYFAHTGKFSLTNLGRWTIGTSVRSLERFYASPQSWLEQTLTLLSVFFEKILEGPKGFRSGWCLAIDETVGKKSGKKTHGLGYHYSSKEDKVMWHIYFAQTRKKVMKILLIFTKSDFKLSSIYFFIKVATPITRLKTPSFSIYYCIFARFLEKNYYQ